MSESTLSGTVTELLNAVSWNRGWGATCSAAKLAEAQTCVAEGERMFYYPPPVGGVIHKWSFMEQMATLTTEIPYSTGTIEVTNDSDVVTLTGGTFPAWSTSQTNGPIEVVIDGVSYEVADTDGNVTMYVEANWAGASASGLSYSLIRRMYYLPDDFGHIVGPLTYQQELFGSSIKIVGESTIRDKEQSFFLTAKPAVAAIRPRASDGTDGQRFEMLLWPCPDESYTLQYRYAIQPNAVAVSSRPYPYGGMQHFETLKAAVLAAVELKYEDRKGAHWDRFMERLTASIAIDAQAAPDYMPFEPGSGERWTPNVRATTLYFNGVALP